MSEIRFVPLNEKHLTLLHQWFQIPHVKKWYARDIIYTLKMIEDKYLPRIKDNKKIPNFIVTFASRPIGYIQMYNLEYSLPDGINSYNHAIFNELSPSKIVGIDLFIAEPEYLKKGIGTMVLDMFIQKEIMNNFEMLVVDPHKLNEQAIKFFRKNGFKELNNINTQSDYLILGKKFCNSD